MTSWKRFRHLHPRVKAAARELVVAKPWRLAPVAQAEAIERFVAEASAAYRMAAPRVIFDPRAGFRNGYYSPETDTIALPYCSVVTLFHEFRHAMQHRGHHLDVDSETDAQDWSHSLLYAVAPRRFRRMAAAGRIVHVRPDQVAA